MSPNYSRQNLRGRSFKGQNLTGANFSYADIRGVDFSSAILKGANFTGALGGLQRKWLITFIVISNSLAILSALSSLSILSLFRARISNIFFESNLIFITISLGMYLALIVMAAKEYFLKYVIFTIIPILFICGGIVAFGNSIQLWYSTDIVLTAIALGGTFSISTYVIIALLTGAFIQDWNITIDTKFDNVRCEYIYMRLPDKDNPDPQRKPDNRKEVFAPGEFGDFIKPIVDTLDLYHNQNIDPRAIAISFKQLAQNYPDAQLRIVGMEVKGKDKFLLRAETASNADKSELSAEYFEIYNQIKAGSIPSRFPD